MFLPQTVDVGNMVGDADGGVWQVKKVEDVVYDLSLRNLIPKA